MSQQVAKRLQEKLGLDPRRLTITYTHTHTAPMLRGAASTIFGVPIPPEHQAHIDNYTERWSAGWKRRPPRRSSRASVAVVVERWPRNVRHQSPQRRQPRRSRPARAGSQHLDGNAGDLHDLRLPLRDVRAQPDQRRLGRLRRGGDREPVSRRRGDGVDRLRGGSNPSTGVTERRCEKAMAQGREIGEEIKRLSACPLRPIKGRVDVGYKRIDLPLAAVPAREDGCDAPPTRTAGSPFTRKRSLAKLDRGEPLRTKVDYPVQTWTFGDDLAMVFLAGEVVVDYSLRLKRELDASGCGCTATPTTFPATSRRSGSSAKAATKAAIR